MSDKHVNDDLYINGKPGHSYASIKSQDGYQTRIEGTVDIVTRGDGTGNNIGKLLIDGVDPTSAQTVTEVTTQTYTALESDQIIVMKTTGLKCTIYLPRITTVFPKTYTIQFPNANQDNFVEVNAFALNEGVAPYSDCDIINGKGDTFTIWGTTDLFFSSIMVFYKPGSITIRATENSVAIGSGNNWFITASSNVPLQSTYLAPVQAASTANVSLAAVKATTVMDGVTLAAGHRILLKDQTDPIQNGIYTIPTGTNATLIRTQDLGTGDYGFTHLVQTVGGTVNHDQTYRCFSTVADSIVGTDSLKYGLYSAAGAGGEIQFRDVISGVDLGFASDPALIFDGTGAATPQIDTLAQGDSAKVYPKSTTGSLTISEGMTTGSCSIGGAMTSGSINLGRSAQTGFVDVKSNLKLSNKSAVTQITSINTGVTVTSGQGKITTVSTAILTFASETFTVTCPQCIDTNSVVTLSITYAGNGFIVASVAPGIGGFNITLFNPSVTTTSAAVVIYYTVV